MLDIYIIIVLPSISLLCSASPSEKSDALLGRWKAFPKSIEVRGVLGGER
jgi:hypothetical protein